jgi:hypothetical protein
MRLLKAKDAKLNFAPDRIGTLITSIVLLVVALRVFASTLPEIGEAGNEVSSGASGNASYDASTTYPLVSLFSSDSILLLAIVGAVLVAVVMQVVPKARK